MTATLIPRAVVRMRTPPFSAAKVVVHAAAREATRLLKANRHRDRACERLEQIRSTAEDAIGSVNFETLRGLLAKLCDNPVLPETVGSKEFRPFERSIALVRQVLDGHDQQEEHLEFEVELYTALRVFGTAVLHICDEIVGEEPNCDSAILWLHTNLQRSDVKAFVTELRQAAEALLTADSTLASREPLIYLRDIKPEENFGIGLTNSKVFDVVRQIAEALLDSRR